MKENWQALRRRYTWHLYPPFDAEFDSSHWWEKQPTNDPIAALYELSRRHPIVAETELERIPLPGSEPSIPLPSIFDVRPSLRWTCRLGMKSWVRLTKKEQSQWKSAVGQLKGLDFRPKESLCVDVTRLAHLAILHSRASDRSGTELTGFGWCGIFSEATDGEWETAIARQAVEAYRKGYVILGVAPDLKRDKAESVILKTYREHSKLYTSSHPGKRARWQDWLPLISEFENDEIRHKKAKSQVFNRYRRLLDSIHFA